MADELPEDNAAVLVDYLRTRDVSCPLCRYNLRGLVASRCPECGQELRLGVSLAEPYLKAWVATLVAVLLPGGVGIVVAIEIVMTSVRYGLNLSNNVSRMPASVLYLLLHVLVCVPLSFAVILFRRRLLRIPRGVQWAWAAVGWTAVGVSLFVFLSNEY